MRAALLVALDPGMIATAPAGRFPYLVPGGIVDPQSVRRRLTCILAADAVGYSKQMGRDEEGTIRVLTGHRTVIDGLIAFHGGRIMSTAGDSVLAEFASVVEAVRCAVEIQEALKTSNDALSEGERMQFRVGVNLGDVVVKDDDLLGDGVNVAARLETIAEPGGICISSSVYDQITGKLDLGFQDIGEQALKNISRPIRVYRVSGTGVPLRPAPAPKPRRARNSLPWGIAAASVVVIAGVVAWQTGWVRFGAAGTPTPSSTAPAMATAPLPSSTPPAAASTAAVVAGNATSAPHVQGDAEAQHLRADAEALKKQAQEVLARARSEADASRAAKTRTDAEAAANRVRIQAEADAARIRAEADAALARAKSGNDAVAHDADARTTKAAAAPMVATAGGRFDGTWNVAVACAASNDNAAGYKFDFPAEVKDNFLRGERRAEGAPGWMRLQGAIQADGSATLDANGLTDNPKYSVNNIASGSPYFYHVAARFDGNHGNGHRLELRHCDLQFAKQ